MEVTSVLVQPPSLVAQIEGKANKAIAEKTKEVIQEVEEKSDEQKAQEAIDLLV